MNNFLYEQYSIRSNNEHESDAKEKEFLSRIEPFKTVNTLEDARKLAEKVIPTKAEVTSFYIGQLKCTVCNTEKLFRLSIDSPEEFVSYNFE